MSKFYLGLSYKDCCILKHGLKNSIESKESKEEWIKANSDGDYNTMDEEKKELEEEKRALERLTEQIDNEKENNHMKAR